MAAMYGYVWRILKLLINVCNAIVIASSQRVGTTIVP